MMTVWAGTAMTSKPTLDDIRRAQERIRPHAYVTPLLRSPELDRMTGSTVLLKAESLQRTGSFKIRGALNRLLQMTPDERARGVIAWSSGNHAQGVAAAAQIVGTRATIVMPADAPPTKRAGTEALGAQVVIYDRAREDREAIGYGLARTHGLVVVPPFDDFDVIAGQGTLGLEIVDQASALGLQIDDVLVPVSGGGLVAGVGRAVKGTIPGARIYSVEPAGYDDHRRSLEAGTIVRNVSSALALCDALLAPAPGSLTWPINQAQLSGGYAVTDDHVLRAVRFALESVRLVVEPGGAVALACLLAGMHIAPKNTVVAVLSGGNVDVERLRSSLP